MIYQVKRFSQEDGEKNSGIGTLGKIGLGLGAVAGTFAAAKTGMLGNPMARGANKIWANAGKMVGNETMMKSGAAGWARARTAEQASAISSRYGSTGLARATDALKAKQQRLETSFLNNLNKPATT